MSLFVHREQVCSAWKVLGFFSSSLVSVDLLVSVFTGIGCVISTSVNSYYRHQVEKLPFTAVPTAKMVGFIEKF